MKIIKFILFGLIVFIGAFAYLAPASLIQKFLPGNISVAGISGTLWNGNIQQVVVDNISVSNTEWSASPISLLAGNIKADVSINSYNLKGNFETSYSGSSVRASDVDLNGELSLLKPIFEKYGLTIDGKFDADFEKLEMENGIPKHADGTLQTFDTRILGVVPVHLGDITSVFEDQTQGVQINLNNTEGELDLNGNITITQNGAFTADLTLSRNSITPEHVQQTMQLIGQQISEDTVKVIHSGQMGI